MKKGTLAYSCAAFIYDGVITEHYREQQLRIDSLCNECIILPRVVRQRSGFSQPYLHIAIETALPLLRSPSTYHSSSARNYLNKTDCRGFVLVIARTKTCVRRRTTSRSPERIVDPIMPVLRNAVNILPALSERPCEALSYRLASPSISTCGEDRPLGSPVFLFLSPASAGETSFFRAPRAQNDSR